MFTSLIKYLSLPTQISLGLECDHVPGLQLTFVVEDLVAQEASLP